MHCTRRQQHDSSTMVKHRFSPEEGIWCQYQCWRNSEKMKNLPLFGMDELLNPDNSWNFTLEDVRRLSWNDYTEHHY